MTTILFQKYLNIMIKILKCFMMQAVA